MKGDFTTDRFDPAKGFNRLLKQQGRVELDSDWNEQAAIQQHLLRGLIVDLLGPAAGPAEHCGFGLPDSAPEKPQPGPGDFLIGAGRYYVDGLVVENPAPLLYSAQRWHDPDSELESGVSYLAFLDVWERHVTWLDDPQLLEPALGGPDTCTRVQTVWQVRTLKADAAPAEDGEGASAAEIEVLKKEIDALQARIDAIDKEIASGATRDTTALKAERTKLAAQLKKLMAKLEAQPVPRAAPVEADAHARCNALLEPLRDWTSGTLAARITPSEPSDSPCVLPPESRYRGLENQLYRIEVHATGDTADPNAVPQFKWSRDNGAVATRAHTIGGKVVMVTSARGFAAGCWAELLTEGEDARGQGGLLAKVVAVEGNQITLDQALGNLPPASARPRLRRWDGTATPIDPGAGEQGWIAIEDGIEIRFSDGHYRAGDYWLIPARVAGNIVWPSEPDGTPVDRAPNGLVHHYAPLFLLTATDSKPFVTLEEDCRCLIARLPCLEPAR